MSLRIKQYGHSCFLVRSEEGSLLVDPGNLSQGTDRLSGINALFISHLHPDHLDVENLIRIKEKNPDVKIIGATDVLATVPDEFEKQEVVAGDVLKIADMHLAFFGGKHAVIHADIPVVGNLGVLIDRQLYYPGDSFVLPDEPIEALAIPIAAPWQKISEAIDFFRKVHPRVAFPVHDAILSDAGKKILDKHFEREAKQIGCLYMRHPENL